MWFRTLVRDVLSPLLGLAIEAHEVAIADQPRYLAVVAGLLLVGVPVDAALRALSSGPGRSSPPTPSTPPSPSPPSDGG